jgi:hypothetical protein
MVLRFFTPEYVNRVLAIFAHRCSSSGRMVRSRPAALPKGQQNGSKNYFKGEILIFWT